MAIYQNSEQLKQALQTLFERIQAQGPQATQAVARARLSIRFNISQPDAEVTIDGKKQPVQVHYGATPDRPTLNVDLTGDAFHWIMLGELRLRKALGSGQMKVKGPVLKTFVLEDVLHQAQAIYPQVAQDMGLETHYQG